MFTIDVRKPPDYDPSASIRRFRLFERWDTQRLMGNQLYQKTEKGGEYGST